MIISPLTESRIHQRSNHGTTSGCKILCCLNHLNSNQNWSLIHCALRRPDVYTINGSGIGCWSLRDFNRYSIGVRKGTPNVNWNMCVDLLHRTTTDPWSIRDRRCPMQNASTLWWIWDQDLRWISYTASSPDSWSIGLEVNARSCEQ